MLKLLLVDDENTVLQGLSHILSQYCPNYDIVGAAQNAADALRLLAGEHVDCVITDVKMPDMNGVELTKFIRSQYPETSVIVHSGYADFEFVRETMKHGACDYLLKPCHYQNIIDTLHKIEERRSKESKQDEERANEELLKEALSGKRVLTANWTETRPRLMVTLASQPGAIERVALLLKERWKSGVMLQGMDELVCDGGHVVMIFPAPVNDDKFVSNLCGVQQFLLMQGYRTYVGIGDRFDDPVKLRPIYEDCLGRMEFASFNEIPTLLNAVSYSENMKKQKPYSFSYYFSIRAMGTCLLKGDKAKLKQVLGEAVEALERLHLYWDPKRLKNDVLKEVLFLKEYLKEHGVPPVRHELIDYVDEVKRQTTFHELMLWVKRVITSFLSQSEGDEAKPGYIQKAVRYMEQHYMEELSLKNVSDTVFLNPWYFSTQFKKWMNVSFSEYVNQLRVRMAKQFLKQKDLKVYEVAEMVGFQDAAYFSTVFKSIERMSPKDYQKTVT